VTRNERLSKTLLSVINETTGRTKLLAVMARELDSPRCVGEQRIRYQKVFDKLTSKDEKFIGAPTAATALTEEEISFFA